jgi:hypothetical protein
MDCGILIFSGEEKQVLVYKCVPHWTKSPDIFNRSRCGVMMDVTHRYLPCRRTRQPIRGLSERQVKQGLLEDGWEVWRGSNIGITRHADIYPNVERKYKRLCELLQRDYQKKLELLQYLCAVHHGMPDYLCHRSKDGAWKFVECKYLHEQLSARQKTCIAKLQSLGFTVEVHKIVDHRTKLRHASVNLKTGIKTVKEKQLKLNSGKIKEMTKELKKVL